MNLFNFRSEKLSKQTYGQVSSHVLKSSAIWRIYFFVLAFSVLSAGTFLYLKWIDIKHDAGIEQTYSNNLVTRSIETVLRKNELMLKVLGARFLELIESGQNISAQQMIAEVMASNP